MEPIHLRVGPLDMYGFSRSGLATYVMVPEIEVCFDLGHCDLTAAGLRHVLLSHVHHDHAGAVVRHLRLRALSSAPPPRIYVPAESRDDLITTLRAHEHMEHAVPQDLNQIVRGVSPGDSFPLWGNYQVRAFDVCHRAPSRGYTVTDTRSKLKEDYIGLPSSEIARLAQQGIPVTTKVTHDLITYVGDSTIETLERNPDLGRSEVLFLEATYLPPDPISAASRYGHTHLYEIVDLYNRRPEALASPHIILKHFSMKYSPTQVQQALAGLPAGLRERTIALL